MKSKIPVIVFFVGLVLGALLSPLRYQIVAGGNMSVYRIDRLTGSVDFAVGKNPFERVK